MSWWVGVACVRQVGSWWIIYFFIVLWQYVCGTLFSSLLGCSGLFRHDLGIFYFLGGIGLGNSLPLFGIWSPLVCFGLYGLSATGEPLRIGNVPTISWLGILLPLYISGLVLGVSLPLVLLLVLLQIQGLLLYLLFCNYLTLLCSYFMHRKWFSLKKLFYYLSKKKKK